MVAHTKCATWLLWHLMSTRSTMCVGDFHGSPCCWDTKVVGTLNLPREKKGERKKRREGKKKKGGKEGKNEGKKKRKKERKN